MPRPRASDAEAEFARGRCTSERKVEAAIGRSSRRGHSSQGRRRGHKRARLKPNSRVGEAYAFAEDRARAKVAGRLAQQQAPQFDSDIAMVTWQRDVRAQANCLPPPSNLHPRLSPTQCCGSSLPLPSSTAPIESCSSPLSFLPVYMGTVVCLPQCLALLPPSSTALPVPSAPVPTGVTLLRRPLAPAALSQLRYRHLSPAPQVDFPSDGRHPLKHRVREAAELRRPRDLPRSSAPLR